MRINTAAPPLWLRRMMVAGVWCLAVVARRLAYRSAEARQLRLRDLGVHENVMRKLVKEFGSDQYARHRV